MKIYISLTGFVVAVFLLAIISGCKKNDDNQSPVNEAPKLTTKLITSITETSCFSGGNVTSDGGQQVTARGVCWSQIADPSLNDTHTTDGSGTGSFTSSVSGLEANKTYYLRAYATNSIGTGYGEQMSFVTQIEQGGGIPCPGIPTVVYGGKTYHTILVGDQCWLRENLNVGEMVSGTDNQTDNGTIEKYCLDNDLAYCEEYGGLYMWDEMMQYVTAEGSQGICPPDWHIPSDTEFKILQGNADTQYNYPDPVWDGDDYMGYNVGLNLKSQTGWTPPGNGADPFGFAALPGGARDATSGSFGGRGLFGCFHTSTEINSSDSWGRKLAYGSNGILRNISLKGNGYSVRCIKN